MGRIGSNFEYCNNCINKKDCFENNWCITMDRGKRLNGKPICDNYKEEE